MQTCVVCCSQYPKRAKTSNDDEKRSFCSEQCVEHYNKNQKLDLSLISEDVTDDVMMSLMDAKVLHYLKCTNSKWKKHIEEYIVKLAPKFLFKAKFGSKGSDNGQFLSPFFVTTDKQGNIYVSDKDNNRIQVFDSKGQWKATIGPNGTSDYEFIEPIGIAINSKNHLIVTDKSYRFQEFNENMQVIMSFCAEGNEEDELNCFLGLAFDSDDNIIVADFYAHCLQIFGKDGAWKQTIGKECSNKEYDDPWDVTVCKIDGRIFSSDAAKQYILVFSSDGKFLFKFGSAGSDNGEFQFPRGLALSNCGQYLLVCDQENYRVQVFNAMNGSCIKSYGSFGSGNGQFKSPSGICVSPSGQILVTDSASCIQIFE